MSATPPPAFKFATHIVERLCPACLEITPHRDTFQAYSEKVLLAHSTICQACYDQRTIDHPPISTLRDRVAAIRMRELGTPTWRRFGYVRPGGEREDG